MDVLMFVVLLVASLVNLKEMYEINTGSCKGVNILVDILCAISAAFIAATASTMVIAGMSALCSITFCMCILKRTQ